MIRMNVSQARSRRLHRVVALGATLMLAAGMSACGALKGQSSSDASAPHTIAPGKTLTVSTSFYPIQYLAEAIGGKLVKVSTVTPSNVEPHDFELSGKETAELGKADLIAYVPGFQPSLDKAVKEVGSGPTVVDLSKPANLVHHEGVEEEHEHGEEAADGAQVRSADTGNLLLDLAVVEDLGLRFDPRYGLTGGEDSLFTRQLTRAGGVIRFAAGAVVTKRVPAARARRAWVLERSLRSGSSWARVRIDTAAPDGGASGRLARLRLRLGYGAKGLAKAGIDGARAGVARIRGDVPAQARYEVSSRGGLGMVVGALGVHVREYGRPRRRRNTTPAGRSKA